MPGVAYLQVSGANGTDGPIYLQQKLLEATAQFLLMGIRNKVS
jgi:hypothetical protein